jgi:integrase
MNDLILSVTLSFFVATQGLGYSEVENLSPDDITVGGDGEKWMNIVRKKTNKPYQVPILPLAQEIIERIPNTPCA